MNRKLLRRVARKHGISVAEVKQGIEEAIDYAYKKPNFHALNVDYKGEKPTADELINHVVRTIK